MAETSVRQCTCKNTFQDAHYGKGMRLHNACNTGWRCTSCTNEKNRKFEPVVKEK